MSNPLPLLRRRNSFLSVLLGALVGLSGVLLAQTTLNVLNPASDLTGKTLVTAEGNRTITGVFTFSTAPLFPTGTAGAPGLTTTTDQTTGFTLGAGSIGGSLSGTQRLLLDGSGLAIYGTTIVNGSGVNLGNGLPVVITTTATGTNNNFNPGIATVAGRPTIIHCTNASLLTITGLAAGIDGQHVMLISDGAGQVDLPYQSGLSAQNFTNFIHSGNTSLKAATKAVAEYVFSAATSNWIMVFHDQGGSIDYSASSTVAGWASFTTKKIYYEVIGSRVYVDFDLEGASNATTVSFTVPYAPSNVAPNFALGFWKDNGIFGPAVGACVTTGATVTCFPDNTNATAWTNSGTKFVSGQFHYQIN